MRGVFLVMLRISAWLSLPVFALMGVGSTPPGASVASGLALGLVLGFVSFVLNEGLRQVAQAVFDLQEKLANTDEGIAVFLERLSKKVDQVDKKLDRLPPA
jgi:hypothetical protein